MGSWFQMHTFYEVAKNQSRHVNWRIFHDSHYTHFMMHFVDFLTVHPLWFLGLHNMYMCITLYTRGNSLQQGVVKACGHGLVDT